MMSLPKENISVGKKEKAAPLLAEKRPWFILREPNPFY
jgi:hypothetical protein